MLKKFPIFMLFFIGGTIFLTFSLYENRWKVVESEYYPYWERNYERVVVARLAKSQQDGIFSAGGLLGLANTEGWNFEIDEQYRIYETGKKVEFYEAYRSHPGHQGIVFSFLDRITDFTPRQTISMMRLITTALSALALGYIGAWIAVEFGWLAAILMLLFSISSQWIILPASNSYWNLWAFYLPFAAGILLLRQAENKKVFHGSKIFALLFGAALVKILFTGFEMITTTWIMATVPVVYYAITGKWTWRVFAGRVLLLGIVLLAATLIGLAILSVQIAANDGDISMAYEHIMDRLNRRALGDPDKYRGQQAESLRVSTLAVLKIYLNTNAFNSESPPRPWQVPYWVLILLFAFCTAVFIINHKYRRKTVLPVNGLALIIATWFSITAPLSWYIIFRPTSYIHTFLFPMAWQMPFTLLGFALCGLVIRDLFRSKAARIT